MTRPRIIEPHAFRTPVGPDPSNARATYDQWNAENLWRFCAVEGCGLTADAQPHWTMSAPTIGQFTDAHLYPGDHLNLTLKPPDGIEVPWIKGNGGTIYMSHDVTFLIVDPVTRAGINGAKVLLKEELARKGRPRKRTLRTISSIFWKLGV